MVVGIAFLVIAALVIGIWLLFGFKRMKHKFVAIILIGLLLSGFYSFKVAFKGKEISRNNISDVGKIFKTYFSWFGTAFGNLKTITGQAVKMDWSGNQTAKAT